MRKENWPKNIRRFPRVLKKMSGSERLALQVAEGKTPNRYNVLTSEQKRLARMVVNGMTVADACRKMGVNTNTYYRYIHYHKLFKKYYISYGRRQAENVEGLLDAKMGRAVRVIEDNLDGDDPYFAHDVAVKLLSGRGIYKKSVDSKNEVKGQIQVDGRTHAPITEAVVLALVGAMKEMSLGGARLDKPPKVIDVEVLASLPPPPQNDLDTEIQEENKRKSA